MGNRMLPLFIMMAASCDLSYAEPRAAPKAQKDNGADCMETCMAPTLNAPDNPYMRQKDKDEILVAAAK